MANFATALKAEILRLARKEVRQQTAALQRASAAHRRQIAALRRQVVALERKAGELGRRSAGAAPVADDAATPRFVAKGLKSLRARLGTSAGDLGRLLGVSGQSVYNWENGKATPRRAQLLALAELRGLGKREVQARLAGAAAAPAARGARKAKAASPAKAARPAKAAGSAKAARKTARRGAGRPARKQAAARARTSRRRAG